MRDYIEERTLEIAQYIIENNATVRQAAGQFGISKSTVHMEVTKDDGLTVTNFETEKRDRSQSVIWRCRCAYKNPLFLA